MRTSFLLDLVPFLSSAFRGGGSKWITAQVRYPHPDLAKGMGGRSISPVRGRALDASEGLPAAPLPLAGLSHGAAQANARCSLSFPGQQCGNLATAAGIAAGCLTLSTGRFPLSLITARVVFSVGDAAPGRSLARLLIVQENTRVLGKPQAWKSGCDSPEELRAVRPRADAAWHSFPEHRCLAPVGEPSPRSTPSLTSPAAAGTPVLSQPCTPRSGHPGCRPSDPKSVFC